VQILETERLILRPFREDDLDALASLFANRDFMRFSGSENGYPREQTAFVLGKFVGWNLAGVPSQFAVIWRDNKEMIGYCGFLHQELDGEKLIEIGYRLDSRYWNRGIATEAAHAVRDHAFRDLHLKHVVSFIHPENHASRRVAEKNGMTLEKQSTFRGFPTLVFGIRRPPSSTVRLPVDPKS
jgi:[ribosomal protein S5]-alanine N-acetyltransferase